MIKQRKDSGTYRDKKENATQGKITIQLEEINQKALVEEGRLKRYQQRTKIRTKQDIPKKKKTKRNSIKWGDDTKTYQQPNVREIGQFWTKIWQP